MELCLRAPYVDRLLADADGALAPIWISALLVTESPPEASALRAALRALVEETPRLRVGWDTESRGWRTVPRTPVRIDGSVRTWSPMPLHAFGRQIFAEPIALAEDLPLRITLAELTCRPGRHVVALQLHHSLGDARSLMFVHRRFWEHVSGKLGPRSKLGDPEMSDRRALLGAARHPRGIASAALPRHRVLASRGTALRRSGTTLGAPSLLSLRVALLAGESPGVGSSLFFAALLGAVAKVLPEKTTLPVRLRIPVDLRRALGIGVTLENACSAVAVELPVSELFAGHSPAAFTRLVPDRLEALLASGTHFGTLLENMLVSRVATRRMLREHLRPDVLASRRASTLVATYVGTVDRYFESVPFPVESVQTQTPTWGANGLVFQGALMINVTAFDGLWPPAEHRAFVQGMRDWLAEHLGRRSEILE